MTGHIDQCCAGRWSEVTVTDRKLWESQWQLSTCKCWWPYAVTESCCQNLIYSTILTKLRACLGNKTMLVLAELKLYLREEHQHAKTVQARLKRIFVTAGKNHKVMPSCRCDGYNVTCCKMLQKCRTWHALHNICRRPMARKVVIWFGCYKSWSVTVVNVPSENRLRAERGKSRLTDYVSWYRLG